MHVRDGMSSLVLTVGPDHTLRSASELMSRRNVGAAVVMDSDQPGPGIITERDILHAVGGGEDLDSERVGNHLTRDVVFAEPNWSLEYAAAEMCKGNFRHLIVVDDGDVVGVLSVRDIVRCWTSDGATSEMDAVGRSAG